MFSFLGLDSKPEAVAPNQSASAPASSMFGGMDVQGASEEPEPISSFSFIGGGEQSTTQSAFSFLQEPIDEQPSNSQQGFSFMSNTTEEVPTEAAVSSFSFMSTEQSDMTTSMMAPPCQPVHTEAPAYSTEPEGALAPMVSDIRLNKTALNKQLGKKKKRATKVGFGRDDDEDGEEKPTQMYVPATAAASCGMHGAGGNAISAIDVDLASLHNALSSEENGQYTSNPVNTSSFPSTPPPLPPTLAPAAATHVAVARDDETTECAVQSSVLPPPVALATTAVPAPVAVPVPVPVPMPAPLPAPSLAQPSVASPPMPSPAETPVQKLERKSRETLAQLTRCLADLSRLHGSALSGQERFKFEIETEMAAIQAAAKRQEEAEEEQGRLAALEEFEKADALNEVIYRSGAEAEARQAVLRDLKSSVRLLEETFAHERAECISNFQRATSSLRVTREQLDLAVAQLRNSSGRQFEMEEFRIRAELERIGLEKGHFQREEEALQGDTERTEEVIRTQTVDLCSKKSDLEASIGGLDEEIRILQEQLAAKMAAQQQLSEELGHVDGKIGEVRKKYDRQLQRISDRQAALEQSKKECLQEEHAVLSEQSALQKQMQESRDSNSSVALWTAVLETDVTIADTLLLNLSPSRAAADGGALASINRLESAPDDATTQELRRNLEAINFLLSKKRTQVGDLQAQRDALLAESRRAGDLLPKLDAEKKSHAANKRFKEAAAVAKEFKDLQAAKDATDCEIEQVGSAAENTLAEIVALEEKHTSTSGELRDAQKQHDVSRFEALLLRAQEVRLLQKEVRKQVRKRQVAREVGSTNGGLQESALCDAAAAFFASELRTALLEAASIKERHGLPQALDIFDAPDDLSDSECEKEADNCTTAECESAGATDCASDGPAVQGSQRPGGPAAENGGEGVGSGGDHSHDKHHTQSEEDAMHPAGAADHEEHTVEVAAVAGAHALGPAEGLTTAEQAEPHADADADADAGADTNAESSADAALRREALMAQAKALLVSIEETNVRLEEASDYEDYEKAAELFEEASAAGELLNKVLETLQCTKEDVQAYQS